MVYDSGGWGHPPHQFRDPESDIYEMYCLAEKLGTGFMVRSCVDRLAEDSGTTIAKVMAEVPLPWAHLIAL